jgi:hypothetical protein
MSGVRLFQQFAGRIQSVGNVTCAFLYIPSLSGGFQSLSRFIPTDLVIMSHFSKLPRKIREKGDSEEKEDREKKTKIHIQKILETQK